MPNKYDSAPKTNTPTEILADATTVIPSFASKVAVAHTSSGNVVLTFISNLPGEKNHLIKRIVIDSPTSTELAKILSNTKVANDD
jgi:hypothetical protein